MATSAMSPGTADPPSSPSTEPVEPVENDADLADRLADYSEDVNARADARAERFVQEHGLERLDQMMSGMINEIVGGIFAIALGVVLLNQLFEVEIIDTAEGPFADTFSTVESIGGAALIFAVLGMLALAGGTAVRMFRT